MAIHNGTPAGDPLNKVVSVLKKGYSAAKEMLLRWKEYMHEHTAPACKKLGESAGDLCETVGSAAADDLKLVGRAVYGKLSAAGNKALDRMIVVTDRVGESVIDFGKRFIKPFRSVWHAPRLIAEGYRRGGAKEAFFTFVDGICNNLYVFKTIVNHALPVLGLAILFSVVQSGLQIDYALAVEQDGEVIAYVEDESVYAEAQRDLRSRIISTEEETELNLQPTFMVAAVSAGDITDTKSLTDDLIRMSTNDIQEAQGLYIDGEFYGAVRSAAAITSLLDNKLAEYTTGAEDETVALTRDVQLREGLYPTASLVNVGQITALLNSEVQSRQTYTVQQGDSPIMIANKNGLTYAEFKAMNPNIEKECLIGQETIIAESEPFLGVEVTRTITYDETIPHETETTEDSSKAQGYAVVTQEGEDGSKNVTARVTLVNGIEEEREILSETVTVEPVTEKVTRGTKQNTTYVASYVSPSHGSGNVNGTMIWPTNKGYISCYYGSGGHRGLDIAAPYGTPIYAAMGGKVVVSGWYYSYGKCVVIDHGNGVRTLYAHCSSLNAAVGQQVAQGELIGKVGSTGYSTGNHLHLEVQINGSNRNPLNYLS